MTIHLIKDQTQVKIRVCAYLECSLVRIRDLFPLLGVIHILCIYKYIPARKALTKDSRRKKTKALKL